MWQSFLDDQPDIVLFSIYLWNAQELHRLAKQIKEYKPDTIIILGGPDISWKQSSEYLTTHWYYDYMVYGDPEKAFVLLLDAVLDNKANSITLLNIPNLMVRDKQGKPIKTTWEIYQNELYTTYSPWMHSIEDVKRDCKIAKQENLVPAIAYETDRGCPYNCSFCDWQAGLHHKVTRRKYTWKDEINLFAELGGYLTISNANFGMYKDDIELIEYAWTLENLKKYPGFIVVSPGFAKLHKKRVFDIYKKYGDIFGHIVVKASLQSLSDDVLTNIDRPGIPWPEHKKMILDLSEGGKEVRTHVELIVGLPGETCASWNSMIYELLDVCPIWLTVHVFMPLPNSPSADPSYMSKYQFDIRQSITPTVDVGVAVDTMVQGDKDIAFLNNQDSAYNWGQLTNNEIMEVLISDSSIGTKSPQVWQTSSFTIEDRLYMIISIGVLERIAFAPTDIKTMKKIYKSFESKMREQAHRDGAWMRKMYDKYHIMPLFKIHNNRLTSYQEYWRSIDLKDTYTVLTRQLHEIKEIAEPNAC